MLRTNIDQADHEPYVYIWDTGDNTVKGLPIPVIPFEEVMDIHSAEESNKESEKLRKFVESLGNSVKIKGLDFIGKVDKYIADNKLSDRTANLLKEAIKNA
jgi:hypothetical protein